MRPAYGSGEDWNQALYRQKLGEGLLRPAYGSGEDWNRALQPHAAHERGCARPTGRARIGTAYLCTSGSGVDVAPGLRVGRGLEPALVDHESIGGQLRPAYGSGEDWNFPDPETLPPPPPLRPAYGSGEDWNR